MPFHLTQVLHAIMLAHLAALEISAQPPALGAPLHDCQRSQTIDSLHIPKSNGIWSRPHLFDMHIIERKAS
jgi:hypothetical protein